MDKGQAERLMPMLEEVLAEAGHRLARPRRAWRRHRARQLHRRPHRGRGGAGAGAGAGHPGRRRDRLRGAGLRPAGPAGDRGCAPRGVVYAQRLRRRTCAPALPIAGRTRRGRGTAPAGSAARRAGVRAPRCRSPRPSRGSPRPRRPRAAAAPRAALPARGRCRARLGPAAGDPAVTPDDLAALHAARFTTPRPWIGGRVRRPPRRHPALSGDGDAAGFAAGPRDRGRGRASDHRRRARRRGGGARARGCWRRFWTQARAAGRADARFWRWPPTTRAALALYRRRGLCRSRAPARLLRRRRTGGRRRAGAVARRRRCPCRKLDRQIKFRRAVRGSRRIRLDRPEALRP